MGFFITREILIYRLRRMSEKAIVMRSKKTLPRRLRNSGEACPTSTLQLIHSSIICREIGEAIHGKAIQRRFQGGIGCRFRGSSVRLKGGIDRQPVVSD